MFMFPEYAKNLLLISISTVHICVWRNVSHCLDYYRATIVIKRKYTAFGLDMVRAICRFI